MCRVRRREQDVLTCPLAEAMDFRNRTPTFGTTGTFGAKPIREHRERQERLEYFAEQARADLAQRRKVLDNVNTIAAYAKDMKDFLNESELTERRAFIQSFVKEIIVVPGDALLRYTVPMPDNSLIPGRSAEKVALNGSVLPTLPDGGPLDSSLTSLDSCPKDWVHFTILTQNPT